MINVASHKNLLEKNVIQEIKQKKDEIEIEFAAISEEQKSVQTDSAQRDYVFFLKKTHFSFLNSLYFKRITLPVKKKKRKPNKKSMKLMMLRIWKEWSIITNQFFLF